MKNIFLTVIFGIIMMGMVQGQDQLKMSTPQSEEPSAASLYQVFMRVRSYGDSIVIRWAPTNAAVWLLGNNYGWNVMREKNDSEFTSEEDTVLFITLNSKPIVPMTLEEMKVAFDSTNKAAGAAAQALYGLAPMQVDANDNNFFNYAFRKNQEQELRQLSAYLVAEENPQIASALGLRFVDKNVKNGEWYNYSLESLIPEQYATLLLPSFLVECKPFVRSYDEMVPEIKISQKDARTAVIYWAKNELSGYYLEQSTDKGKHWTAVNTAPIYPSDPDESDYAVFGKKVADLKKHSVIFIDSLKLNVTYQYRVKAFDAFGDYAPYNESPQFEMVDLIPPSIPVMVSSLPVKNETCVVEWYKDTIEEDFKGFVLTFADSPEGPWSNVSDMLPPTQKRYIDKKAGERGRGYYRIFAVDETGNISYSLSIINNIEDEKAPSAPTGLEALVDSTGAVYFQWNKNPEKDVFGYRVYFANQKDHTFTENSNGILEQLFYTDTIDLHTLTPFVYYFVRAEDNSHNLSKPSDTIAVPIPDIVPPGVALLKDFTTDEKGVTMRWYKSTSTDVAFYYIYRKSKNAQQWQCIQVYTPAELPEGEFFSFVDVPLPSNIAYNYCIEVLDDSRLSSGKSGIITVNFDGSRLLDIPIKFKVSSDKKKKSILLNWEYEYNSDNDHYGVIYRSVNDGEFIDIYKFNRGETSFKDTKLNAGDKVTYYIQLFLGSGKRSKPSKTESVSVNSAKQ